MNKKDYGIYYGVQEGSCPRRTGFNSGPVSQPNLSILIADSPVRRRNAWNEDRTENVNAQWIVVKLQARD